MSVRYWRADGTEITNPDDLEPEDLWGSVLMDKGRLRRAGVAVAYFQATWDPEYLNRFGVGDTISDVISPAMDLDPETEVSSLLLSAAEALE
jgi:hypothetical protein